MSAPALLPAAPTQLNMASSSISPMAEDASQKAVALEEKIDELTKKQARDGGLSPHNENHLIFLRHHHHLEKFKADTGQDIVLVIRPIGAIMPRRRPKAKVTECLPEVAAEILAFASVRRQEVRLATPNEIKAYRQHNLDAAKHAQGVQAQAMTRIAQAQLQAVLGQATALQMPAVPQPKPPEAPEVVLDVVDPGENLEDMSGTLGAPSPADAAAPGQPPAPIPADMGLDERIKDIGNDKTRPLIIQAGFTTLEGVADSDVATLSKIKGIGNRSAAKLITEATAIVESAKDEEDGTDEAA